MHKIFLSNQHLSGFFKNLKTTTLEQRSEVFVFKSIISTKTLAAFV